MGRGSVRQNKNKFQLIREDLGLSREKAAELLETVSPERIEKIESGKCAPTLRRCLPSPESTNGPACAITIAPSAAPSARPMCRRWK